MGVAGNPGEDDNKKGGKDFIDTVCDPCGFMDDDGLEQALAHKNEAPLNADTIEIPEDEKNAAEADAAVDSVLSNFDCCGKTLPAGDEAQVQEFPTEKIPEDEENQDEDTANDLMMKNGESGSVMTGSNSHQTRSLDDIAAKMDEIDLETAAEDTAGDQMSEDGSSSIKKMGNDQEWYKQPLYAGLIFLCCAFSIAIFVMAVLLIADKN